MIDQLDPIPESHVMGKDPSVENMDRLNKQVLELQRQNTQLLKERDSAVGMASRILSRLNDTLNLGRLEAQSHDRLVQSYTEQEAPGGGSPEP